MDTNIQEYCIYVNIISEKRIHGWSSSQCALFCSYCIVAIEYAQVIPTNTIVEW